MSVNVNGFTKKHLQVEELVEWEGVLILAMQETLVAVRHYLIVIKGYQTFTKPWEKEFRGQAVHLFQVPALLEQIISCTSQRRKAPVKMEMYSFLEPVVLRSNVIGHDMHSDGGGWRAHCSG